MKAQPFVIASICAVAFVSVVHAQQAEIKTNGATGGARIAPLSGTDAEATLKSIFEVKTAPTPKMDVQKKAESHTESHTESHSSAISQHSTTTSINGKTVNIMRSVDGDGKETVKITTFSRSGKPKVEEMSAEDFDAKYNKKKGKAAKADQAAKPAPADNATPAPTATGKATE